VKTERNAEFWQSKAKSVRQQASTMRNAQANAMMLEVAANYEQLALIAEVTRAKLAPQAIQFQSLARGAGLTSIG